MSLTLILRAHPHAQIDADYYLRLGIMASCFMGFFIVCMYGVMSLLVLMK